ALLIPLLKDPAWKPRVCRRLGHLRVQARDFDGARTLYNAAPGPDTALDLGRAALIEGDPDTAAELFQQSLAAGRGVRAARYGHATAAAQRGAPKPLAELTAEPSLSAWAQAGLGDQAYEANRLNDALSSYEAALPGMDRVPTGLLCRLAAGYLELGRQREAL